MSHDQHATSPASPNVSIARLPATSSKLFGREADLAWLDAAWNEGANVATIVAWGGVGKSALVNRWLATLIDKEWLRHSTQVAGGCVRSRPSVAPGSQPPGLAGWKCPPAPPETSPAPPETSPAGQETSPAPPET